MNTGDRDYPEAPRPPTERRYPRGPEVSAAAAALPDSVRLLAVTAASPRLPAITHRRTSPVRCGSRVLVSSLTCSGLRGPAFARAAGEQPHRIRRRRTWPQVAGGVLIAGACVASAVWYVPRVMADDRRVITGTVSSSGVVALNFAGSGEISKVNVHLARRCGKERCSPLSTLPTPIPSWPPTRRPSPRSRRRSRNCGPQPPRIRPMPPSTMPSSPPPGPSSPRMRLSWPPTA